MPNRNFSRKKVFIASSKEVYENGYIEPIIEILLKSGFEPHPWYNEFPSGEIILERLIDLVNEMDFAIFFFTEDIRFTWRNEEVFGTAWNVVLEYGMFLQRLNRERVRIIQCGKTHIPTDLNGLVVSKIDENESDDVIIKIKDKMFEITRNWQNVPSLNDDFLGISKSIVEQRNELEHILAVIARHQKVGGLKEPLVFDEKLVINFYLNGLAIVEKRFWTTTYLSSGFWSHKTDGILPANTNMLNRLSRNKFKDVKRLFLIRRDLVEELNILRKKLSDYKNRRNGDEKISELKSYFRNLRESCKILIENGCEIKFTHDIFGSNGLLDDYIINGDTEIAIYDDYRIDFFDGGKKRKITGVKIITYYHRNFKDVKFNSEKYFTNLWNEGKDINILIGQFDLTFKYYDKKIDYDWKKLTMFDEGLNERDSMLKYMELEAVTSYLANFSLVKEISSYLDVGTCTGRYPFELRNILASECIIFGCDSDPDCIEYAKVKKEIRYNRKNNVTNIHFLQADFLFSTESILNIDNKYDLITCMLGTLSHFGWDLDFSDNFNDSLQNALKKMSMLLSEKGLLIISNWTNFGIDYGMLSIYSEKDRRILKLGTENKYRLKKRLEQLSLHVSIETIGREKELDVFFCTKI